MCQSCNLRTEFCFLLIKSNFGLDWSKLPWAVFREGISYSWKCSGPFAHVLPLPERIWWPLSSHRRRPLRQAKQCLLQTKVGSGVLWLSDCNAL